MKRIGWIVAWLFVGFALLNAIAHADSGATPKMKACYAKYFDHYVIADKRANGMTKEAVIASATANLQGERLEVALQLIEQAYAAEDIEVWFEGYWLPCLEESGEKTGFHRVAAPLIAVPAIVAASSQRLYCDSAAKVAESMLSGFRNSDFKPEHIVNAHQRRIADWAMACEKSARTLRECVIDRCMERRP